MTGVFFGTSAFAVPSLRAFAKAVDCRLVVTQPDRPAGRGQKLQPTPVKVAALELGVDTLEPQALREARDVLQDTHADLFAVASYGKIVPQTILNLPRLAALNVHPSLLPLYRGATPLQGQLRDGVTTGGVTIIVMDSGMDTGDIALQEKSAIRPDETYGELHDRFAEIGAELLARACAQVADGTLHRTPQTGLADPELVAATATRPLSRADLELDWRWPAARIVNFVRSLSPLPAARAELAGVAVKLVRAGFPTSGGTKFAIDPPPGTLVGQSGNAALVTCGDGQIAIERLVPANRGPVDGKVFALARLTSPT
jgi:methionyl-tRNA formyltransferase